MLPLRDELPTRTFPFINYALIAANALVFFGELSGAVGASYEYVPARLWVDPVNAGETIFTAMFMHAGWMHIGGNMLFLWIFGDNVEDAMGHLRYLAFYVLGGLCAAVAQTAVDPLSRIPMLGASGAIAAVLAAYVFLYPRSPVTVLNPIPLLWLFWGLFFRFPAWLVIGEFFVVNLWAALNNSAQGGVAFAAHVGGFLGGAILFRLFLIGRPPTTEYDRHERWVRRRGEERWS
jgi:membrane associated rhomboid family serine protease